jgi:Ca-activated chloride channel family protein
MSVWQLGWSVSLHFCRGLPMRNIRFWLVVSCALASSVTLAHGQERRTLSPYFVVSTEGGAAPAFVLKSTHVHADVNGVIADVRVEQRYHNQSKAPITARYVFPASTRAAVHGLRIRVGQRAVVAKIAEKKQAEQQFEAAAASGKTASLLSADRPNVFTMAVANIMPGDEVVVELRYSELLVPEGGTYQFVYPTVVGPRYAGAADDRDAFVESPFLHEGEAPPSTFALDARLSTALPLAAVRCSSHTISLERPEPTLATLALDDDGRGGDRDFILEFSLAGARIQTGLMLYEGQGEKHFLLMVQPPARVSPEQIPAREYVFVLDVSGSMGGFPLDTAKILIRDLIGKLRPSDAFNVLLFSGDSQRLAPRSLPARPDNVARALAFITAAGSGGGTELEAALREAVALPRAEHVSRSVVVLTDGYIAQERGAFELIAQHLSNTNLFAFGVGSTVNRFLIEGLARAGQGEPFIVTTPAEARAAAVRFSRYIAAPLLTEVSVRFHGFDAYDVEPVKQPDLFAERPLVVLGKYRGDRRGTIEVAGRTASAPFATSIPVASAIARAENAALPRLWARSRIARLSDFNVDGADEAAVREVTRLGLKYGLLTAYTSFIAVLEQIRNPGGEAANVAQPSPLPLGVPETALSGEYAAGAEPELPVLLGMLLAAFAWTAHRRRARGRT